MRQKLGTLTHKNPSLLPKSGQFFCKLFIMMVFGELLMAHVPKKIAALMQRKHVK